MLKFKHVNPEVLERNQKIDSLIEVFGKIEFHRQQVKEYLSKERLEMEERKILISEEWFRLCIKTREFPFKSFKIQLEGIKMMGFLFKELKDHSTAIYYYRLAVRIE